MKRLFLLLILLSSTTPLLASDWQVDAKAANRVVFHSKSTLIDFDGTSNAIDGYIYWDGNEPFSGKNKFYFEVQLETFVTGNGKRDRDMRNDVLQTAQFPMAKFSGSLADIVKKGTIWTANVSGVMNLHGKQKNIKMPATISIKNGLMHAQTAFSLSLQDFGIKAPQLIAFIKVADELTFNLDVYLKEYID